VLVYLKLFPEVLMGILHSEPDPPQVLTHTQSWGKLQINRSVSETPLSIQGRRYWKGLGTHADSSIRVRTPEHARVFIGACGIDDLGRQQGEFTCSIRKDGAVVWQSASVSQRNPLESFQLPVSPQEVVELVITAGTKGIDNAHANWVNMRFEGR
jgi:hypothetical protein